MRDVLIGNGGNVESGGMQVEEGLDDLTAKVEGAGVDKAGSDEELIAEMALAGS